VLNFFYPPLVRTVKIEICLQDSFGEDVLGVEYLDLEKISGYASNAYFLPTFGPRYVDFYSEPNTESVNGTSSLSQLETNETRDVNNDDYDLAKHNRQQTYNSDWLESKNYLARVLLSVSSRVVQFGYKSNHQYIPSENKHLLTNINQKKKFTAFILLSEVYMIDKRVGDQEVSFQLAIGSPHNFIPLFFL
jgi:hypothetical protein